MSYKIKVLQRYYDEVWSQGNLAAIDTILSPDVRSLGIMPGTTFDKGELAELVTTLRELLGTIKITICNTIEQDDWLAALVEIKSIAAHTGAPVHVSSHMITRFDGVQICEIHSGVDSLSLFEQLGLLPENAMAVMLGGTALR